MREQSIHRRQELKQTITPDEAGQLEIMAHDGRNNPTLEEAHGMCNGLQHH